MFWGKGAKKQTGSYGDAQTRIRSQHIDALQREHPNTKALDIKRTAFDVPISIPGITGLREPCKLRVMLPAQFPVKAPVISLMPLSLRHRLLDTDNHIAAHDKLSAWNPHCHLGHLVSDIIEQLKTAPPTIDGTGNTLAEPGSTHNPDICQPSPAMQQAGYSSVPKQSLEQGNSNNSTSMGGQQRDTASNATSTGQQAPAGRPTGLDPQSVRSRGDSANVLFTTGKEFDKPNRITTQTQLPPVPVSFPSLANMTTDELNNLLLDSDGMSAFVASLDILGNMQSLENELKEDIPRQAERILSTEEDIAETRKDVLRLRERCIEAQNSFNDKTEKQQVIMERFAPRILLGQLEQARDDADAESEETAHLFLRGDMSVSDFMKTYSEQRKRHHLRKSKADVFRRQHVR